MRLRIVVVALMFGLLTTAAESGLEMYQRAVTQERAGKLEEAIKLYEKVAHDFASDRALAAKALLQAARGYEKFGQDKAIKLYEQVARDYGDQREPATTARNKLASLRAPAGPATLTQRKIEIAAPAYPRQRAIDTTDGQQTIFYDPGAGGLVIGDLAGRNKRVIRKGTLDELGLYVPSRDFSMVAVIYNRVPDQPGKIAVMKTDGTGYRELTGINFVPALIDWSWDNRYLASGGRHLAILSIADGATREILPPGNPDLAKVWHPRFSPDGRYIAYTDGPPGEGKIMVAPVQGGEPRVVAENSNLLDWTRDGRFIGISNAGSGSKALYLVPVKDGAAAGTPVFVRYGAFQNGEGRTTTAGGLLYASPRPEDPASVFIGSLDPNGHVTAWQPLDIGKGQARNNVLPDWSPDGSQIAYVASNDAAGQAGAAVRVRNIATGVEREIYRSGDSRLLTCLWARQHPNLFCTLDFGEIFSIATDSGRVDVLAKGLAGRLRDVSPDDRELDFDGGGGHWRLEIATGQRTLLEHSITLSPDGQWQFQARAVGAFDIRPASGGAWTPLLNNAAGLPAFTPDSKWIVYPAADPAGNRSLFRISPAGGQPERMGDLPAKTLMIPRVSPDGRKILVASNPNLGSRELWLLENFVPAAK
jgi:Tol biopolymer transport system component